MLFWLKETGQICGFRAFPWERMENRIAWNFLRWCILTTSRTDYILVTVFWFSSFWGHFDLVKRVKFVVSGPFAGERTERIAWNFACWCILTPPELIRFWSWSDNLPPFDFDLVKWLKFRGFSGDCMKGIAWNFACWCILTTFRTD